jgi:ABC-type branched-subunit amino acid transport system substrate-binding protein
VLNTFLRRGAAGVALAIAIAGCGATGSSGSGSGSAVLVSGHTLRIVVSVPQGVKANPVAGDVVDAEKLAFLQESHEVTGFHLQLKILHGAVLSDNARRAIQDQRAIAYLGEVAPGASEQTIGITNAQQLLQVSPTDTALELGQGTSAVPGSPQNFFESWSTNGRTFARVVPTSAQEAKALVAKMKSMGTKSVFVAHDTSNYGKAIAQAVRTAAASRSLPVSTSQSGAGAEFYGAQSPGVADRFFNAAAKASPQALLFGSSSLDTPKFRTGLAADVQRLYISTPGLTPGALGAAGRSFTRTFTKANGHRPASQAIFGYAAMSAVLHVLAQAGTAANNRQTVVRDFMKLKMTSSVLGPFTIDSSGNTSLDSFVINHVS